MPAAVVSPHVMSGCQFDEFEPVTHVTPNSPLSSVTSSSQFSPTKSGLSSASGMDRAEVHSLLPTEIRRDSFPPYVSATTKRSTAIVAPSLARPQSTRSSTSVTQSVGTSLLRFPPLPSSSLQLSVPPPLSTLSIFPPRSTQSSSKVTSDFSRRNDSYMTVPTSPVTRPPSCAAGSGISYSLAMSNNGYVSRSSSRSLLAPSSAASSGISYSLAVSSALSSGSQANTANFSARQSVSRTAQLHHLRPVISSSSNLEQRAASARELSDVYMEHRNTRDLSAVYNDLYPTSQRGTSAANIAVTTVSRTTFPSSQSLVHRANASRQHVYQTSRAATAQYPAGLFPSSSAPSASSLLQSLQVYSNSGRFAVET